MTAPLRAWDRRADESGPAFEAFASYRDAGPSRSLEAVTAALEKSWTLISRWSGRHEWVARVAAYDTDIARRASERTEEDDVEALARQVRTMRAVQAQMGKRLLMNAESVAPAEAGRLLIAATREEREARRLPARHEHTGKDGGPIRHVLGFEYSDEANDGSSQDDLV